MKKMAEIMEDTHTYFSVVVEGEIGDRGRSGVL